MKNSIKLWQSVTLTVLMVVCAPLVISGQTYVHGLAVLTLVVIISFYLLFAKHPAGSSRVPVWIALGMWAIIPLSLLVLSYLSFPGYGLSALSSWARFSLILGIAATLLTSALLFLRRR
jgi:hypothetical protein